MLATSPWKLPSGLWTSEKERKGDENKMAKKAVITICLVEESTQKSNRQIEKEIMTELRKEQSMIPWLKKVEKVTVTEA
jgi:hypothetical protein